MKTSKKMLSLLLIAAMLVSVLCMGVSASDTTFEPVSISEGEPVKIVWSGTTGTVVNVDGGTYIPASFLLWVEGTSTVTVGTTAVTASMTNTGNNGYVIPVGSTAQTITVNITESSMGAVGTYTITCPAQNGTAPTSIVKTVEGYLPVGQFARGTGWGTATGKFTTSGYESTGVSLGAAGGYIQMDLTSPVYNLATNPYGVDFIVYGNAFNGNPEAGAVKVFGYKAGDTTGAWYDLAGSLYYDSISKNNATVSYKKVTTASGEFTSAGIWYKMNDGDWTKFNTNTSVGWWPTADEYVNGWGSVDGVTWDQTNDIITYTGVSLVKDTDTTNDYQFGYFDIHVNGSDYGVAQNPYTITNTTKGGDGFDLSWAVDSNGTPVNLTHITKVRVYTAAALTSNGTAFTTPSIFGETSAEFCGIFAAQKAASNVGFTGFAGITQTSGTVTTTVLQRNVLNQKTVTVPSSSNSTTLTITSGADTLMIKDAVATTGDTVTVNRADGSTQYFRVIAQSGTKQASVTVVKVVFE